MRHGTPINPEIGLRVMLVRRRRGMTQRKLAQHVSMSPNSVLCLEKGKQSVSAERLAEIARVLQCSVDYLLGLREEVSCGAPGDPMLATGNGTAPSAT
jgi:transcriptional regulator with XRE-family HTH domain